MQISIKNIKKQALSLSIDKALDKFFKGKNFKLNFENLHMKYYYFDYQCKNYFKIAEAKDNKCVFLQLCWFGMGSIFAGNNIRPKSNVIEPYPLYRTSLRFFSKKILKNFLYLLIASKIKFNKIFNINRKKYKTGFLTWNTFNLF